MVLQARLPSWTADWACWLQWLLEHGVPRAFSPVPAPGQIRDGINEITNTVQPELLKPFQCLAFITRITPRRAPLWPCPRVVRGSLGARLGLLASPSSGERGRSDKMTGTRFLLSVAGSGRTACKTDASGGNRVSIAKRHSAIGVLSSGGEEHKHRVSISGFGIQTHEL